MTKSSSDKLSRRDLLQVATVAGAATCTVTASALNDSTMKLPLSYSYSATLEGPSARRTARSAPAVRRPPEPPVEV